MPDEEGIVNSESARYEEFYRDLYIALLEHIGYSHYRKWSFVPIFQDEAGKKLLENECIGLMSNFHENGESRLFIEALSISETRRGFAQIKLRLSERCDGIGYHNEWIAQVDGYEFGFFIVIFRYVQNIRRAEIFIEKRDMESARNCMLKADELEHIVRTLGESDIVGVYEKLGGDGQKLHHYRMRGLDIKEEVGIIVMGSYEDKY